MKLAALWLAVMLFLSLSVSPVSSVGQEASPESSTLTDNNTSLNNLTVQENPQPQNPPEDPPSEILFSDDFNDGDAAGWTVYWGDWAVINGEYVYGSRGITDVDGVVAAGDVNWTDYVFESRFKLISGEPQVYLLFRLTDYFNYERYDSYSFQYSNDRWAVSRWYTETRIPTLLAAEPEPSPISPGVWYDVKVEVSGDRIRCYLNGVLKIDMSDSVYPVGRIGFRGNYNKLAFDDVVVRSLVTDTTPPVSSVDPFEGDAYWKQLELGQSFIVSTVAVDDLGAVENVELWYRYSLDNWTDDVAWKKRDWQLYDVDTDGADGWSWSFNAPHGYGYYQFYSIATDGAGNSENASKDENENIVADSQCRVCRELVRVAVILAEPSDVSAGLENFGRAKERWQDWNAKLNDFFTEVSYGALATTMTILDDDGYWYRLPGGQQDYFEAGWIFRSQKNGKKKFVDDAIELVGQRVDLGGYDIIVVAAGPWIWTEEWRYCWDEAQPPIIDWWGDSPPLVAHEIAHGLGRALGKGELLPDLYPESEISAGDVDGWDLMGEEYAPWVHLSSWSKEWLGWLRYEPVDWAGTSLNYWEEWVDALPTLGYRSEVYSHRVIDWEVPIYEWFIQVGTMKAKTDYIPEVRTRSENYSHWDTWVPGTGLVLYEVDVAELETWLWGWSGTWVTEVEGSPFTEDLQHIPLEDGVYLRILENRETTDTFQMRISARRGSENQLWAIMRQVPIRLSENVTLSSVTPPWPDLDLHAYTPDGRHIGVNYETGEYEMEIEGALASGDRFNGGEWIRLPAGVEVYFSVSSHDVYEFLVNNPPAQLELENGIYAIGFRYHDERGERYESAPIGQVIEPGAEVSNPVNVVLNPDGTYSVGAGLGWDMFDLAAWNFVIDNIPDDIFTKNPSQRKNALKEKFEDVFEKLDGAREETLESDTEEAREYYQEAVEKLSNDILKKLDGDGKADWVRRPILVNELRAFIGLLNYKMNEIERR